LISEFKKQFQNNPFRNYSFVDNKLQNVLFCDSSPDPDDSSGLSAAAQSSFYCRWWHMSPLKAAII